MQIEPLSDETLKETVDAFDEFGSRTAAAKALGVPRITFGYRLKVAIKRGYSPKHDMSHIASDGFMLKGISTLRDASGNIKLQWEKVEADKERQHELMIAVIEDMCKNIPRLIKLPKPKQTLSNLLNLYTFTDYHMGMLAWHKEGGADWDLEIAEKMLGDCFKYMVAGAPQAKHAVILQLGDFLHTDGLLPVTPLHGHILDTDSRFSKIVTVTIRALRNLVDMALLKHETVHVVMAEGNHDMAGSVWLRAMFRVLYEDEPRVTVNESELPYYAHRFGNVMLGFSHGHMKKRDNMPLLFAAQFSKIWGETTKRYIHCGHLHHEKVGEHSGVKVIQHPTLSARDSFASRGGFISERQAECITYHSEFGKVASNIVTPEML